MPFGLRNAAGIFLKIMDVILAAMKLQLELVYLDDAMILSKIPKKHIRHITEAFILKNNVGDTLKLKAIQFFNEIIELCCTSNTAKTSRNRSHTIDCIRWIQEPTIIMEIRLVLGLRNVFRRFVSIMARQTVL